jgi:hypothetical protein
MKISGLKILALPLVFALMSGVAASAQIVSDGNFNWSSSGYQYQPTGSPEDAWAFTGGTGIQSNGSAWGFSNAPNGAAQTAFLQSWSGTPGGGITVGEPTSTISQTVAITPGDWYTVSFYLAERGGYTPNPVTVSIGGDTLTTITPSSDAWKEYSVSFQAPAGPDTLTFSVTDPIGQDSYDIDTGLADVSMNVPEGGASSQYLLLAGLVCFGAMFASRKPLGSRA